MNSHPNRRLQPDHFALAALALLAVAFWGNCLWGGKVPVAAIYQKQMLPWSAASQAGSETTRQWDSLLWDSMAQFYPWRLLLHKAAQQGELPLWNPYQFCGYPFVGNGQSALFYPPNWLYFLVPPQVGLGLSAALHYFFGSLFIFGLARKWRLDTLPAVFAALAFTYGGFMVTWIELPTLVDSLIWLPLAWWGIEAIVRAPASSGRGAARGVVMLATALGMTLLAGHFQIAAYVWVFTALYGVARLLGLACRRDARAMRRVLGAAAAAVVVGGMLAAAQLLPTLELGRYSARGAGGPSAAGFEFHRQRALQPIELLTLLQADFLGTPVDGSYRGISYSEHCPFVGATTILLGLLGLIMGWRRKQVWLFFGIAAFALWAAMAGPPARLLYWGVPKLGQAGGFSRLLSVWTLAAALWGAVGLQVLLDRASTVGRGLVPRRPLPGNASDGGVQAPALQTAKAAVAVLALLLLAAELLPWAYRFNPRVDADDVYPETELIRQLRQRIGSERYVAINDRRAWGLARVPADVILPPNAGTVYGLRSVDGYDSLFPLVYRAFAGRMEQADPSPLANGNMLLMQDGLPWESHGAAYIVARPSSRQPGAAVGDADGLRLWQAQERPAAGSRRGYLIAPTLPVTILEDDLNHTRLDVSAASQVGLRATGPSERPLVLYDSYYPGWRCSVDGKARAVSPYEAAFRTVALEPGDRVADMVYYPASVACGLFVSLLALTALTVLGTSGFWRRRT